MKAGSVTLEEEDLLVLTGQGLPIRAPATPDGFESTARVQAVRFGARGFPALADGLFFAGCKDRLVCLNLETAR